MVLNSIVHLDEVASYHRVGELSRHVLCLSQKNL